VAYSTTMRDWRSARAQTTRPSSDGSPSWMPSGAPGRPDATTAGAARAWGPSTARPAPKPRKRLEVRRKRRRGRADGWAGRVVVMDALPGLVDLVTGMRPARYARGLM